MSRALTIILSVLALLVWLLTLSLLGDLTGSDAAGNGMAQGFAAVGLIVLWVLLAITAIRELWSLRFMVNVLLGVFSVVGNYNTKFPPVKRPHTQLKSWLRS